MMDFADVRREINTPRAQVAQYNQLRKSINNDNNDDHDQNDNKDDWNGNINID